MDIFGIGIWEVLIILIVALIVVGPGRVAEIGMKLGKMARALKKASFDLTAQVTKELDAERKEPSDSVSEKHRQRSPRGGKQGADKNSL